MEERGTCTIRRTHTYADAVALTHTARTTTRNIHARDADALARLHARDRAHRPGEPRSIEKTIAYGRLHV